MLKAHTASVAVLPARYAGKTKVAKALDLLSRAFSVLLSASKAFPPPIAESLAWRPDSHEWGEQGPIARGARAA